MQLTIINQFPLSTKYDPRQSFYGKAQCYLLSNGAYLLTSYNNFAGYINNQAHQIQLAKSPSATTTRHQLEFMRQFGPSKYIRATDLKIYRSNYKIPETNTILNRR